MKNQAGFTLIELMVTIAILAIVLGIAIPSFSNILMNNRIDTAAQELYGALQLARSEGVKRKEGIRICRSNADFDECANGTDWSSGWLMVESGEVLRVWQPGAGLVITGPIQGVTFFGSGMANAEEEFEIEGPSCVNDQKRAVKVIRIGTTTLRKTAC